MNVPLLVAAILGLLGGTCAAQENPVTNGGFETVDAAGRAVDWQVLGRGRLVPDAFSGNWAMLLERDPTDVGECGLNREWRPHDGKQGTMLSQLKGGVTFRYRADRGTDPTGLVFYVIPMSADPFENTGEPRAAYVIPRHHIGDGQWHQGVLKYDFTGNPKVKWVHLSPRVSGSTVRLLLDDIAYVESVGPLPAVRKLRLEEVPGQEGEQCLLHATLRNDGDQGIGVGVASLTTPDGLTVEGGPLRPVQELAPDATTSVSWRILGTRADRGWLEVNFSAGEHLGTSRLEYAPVLEAAGLLVENAVFSPADRAVARLVLRNTGHAMVRGITAELRPGVPLATPTDRRRQVVDVIRPQTSVTVSWEVSANRQAPAARLTASAEALNAERVRGEATVVVGGPMPTGGGPQPSSSGVSIEPASATIHNDQVRLVFPRSDFGYGIGVLQRRIATGWQTLGKLPRLSRLAVRDPQGKTQEHLVYASEAREIPSPAAVAPEMLPRTLQLTGKLTDENDVQWTFTQTVILQPRGGTLRLSVRAVPDRPAEVLAVDGPMLLAGDGAPQGTRRLDAIFPGLEWLVEGEESSSSLDIAPDHPDRIRFVPHPHAVTIPLMCARFALPEGPPATLSLQWDHLQPYCGKLDRPSAAFASPDRFGGRAATLMGLLAPSLREYIYPNELVAHTPLLVTPQEPIELQCSLVVQEASAGETALQAVQEWFATRLVPEPNPLPHGQTLQDEILFSMAAYLDTLWLPDQEMWRPYIGGPGLWDIPARPPAWIYDLRMCLETCPPGEVREAVQQRYDRVVELSGAAPEGDDLGFHFAGPADRLQSRANRVSSLIRQQEEDGSWRFRARIETTGVFKGMDYSELGPDRAAEVGTCARNAWEVLSFARMTGDPRATEAGLKALAFMDRFEVPRAAQVWEVPVHTPDILASADACEAYLEGYLITGDRKYLDKAVYWAWTGLPFIYTWDTPGYEFLKYASIPVFGATWFQGSWFARPVQWNGLRYAYALLCLAPHDQSLDWTRIARGITVSAMYQQSSEEQDKALWPDSVGAIDRVRSGWIFGPQQILKNVYALMGMQPTPLSAQVKVGFGRIIVTAAGAISTPQYDAGRLTCTVTYTPPQTGYVLICNTSRPLGVRVNGEAAREVETPANAAPPCWRFIPSLNLVELRLAGSGQHAIILEGVGYEPTEIEPRTVKTIAFAFDTDAGGWQPANDLGALSTARGVLTTRTTGPDPYLVRTNCDVPAHSVRQLRIRMALAPGMSPNAQLFWITADDPRWDEPKSRHFPVVADGEFHDYVVPLADHPLWQGTVIGIRLDPTGGPMLGEVRVDEIIGE